ncbi:hypothetical protein GLAREA_06923 [Glarea lozoyensis ATCC 20868]|uniref:Uncharacterized protein n=1 Tax=Glarea lozoyensis (strain ATCC 20868 / MF5171) TaxID=1116229 RepID=S3D838_GLAL2|nr:uncharacterized protein GLAREA_06923 [Glarea lozoyensis ATCC 20868]EPE33910.1 hypothetical protein GLAREA_06923 [Glarea lozoyensis ATCC 20868]
MLWQLPSLRIRGAIEDKSRTHESFVPSGRLGGVAVHISRFNHFLALATRSRPQPPSAEPRGSAYYDPATRESTSPDTAYLSALTDDARRLGGQRTLYLCNTARRPSPTPKDWRLARAVGGYSQTRARTGG